MAKNNNLYCPNCGEKLWYSQADKSYRCVNPNCPRSPKYDKGTVEMVKEGADEDVESII